MEAVIQALPKYLQQGGKMPEIPKQGRKNLLSVDKEFNLTPQEKEFCDKFAADKEYIGNGTRSYIATFYKDLLEKGELTPVYYNRARTAAAALLAKPTIVKYISNLLDTSGFNESNVDKHLLFIIEQFSDLSNKLGGIKEFNKLKGRIQDKLAITGTVNLSGILADLDKQQAVEGEVIEPSGSL
jgi:hypothetical protein